MERDLVAVALLYVRVLGSYWLGSYWGNNTSENSFSDQKPRCSVFLLNDVFAVEKSAKANGMPHWLQM